MQGLAVDVRLTFDLQVKQLCEPTYMFVYTSSYSLLIVRIEPRTGGERRLSDEKHHIFDQILFGELEIREIVIYLLDGTDRVHQAGKLPVT